MLKLDLGCGDHLEPGWIGLDRFMGLEVYPLLAYPSNSVDEIRASHILEHFSSREVADVLGEWVRVLRPGGLIKIAVPDFAYIAQGYLEGKREPFGSFLFGGQTDANDYHKTVFDADRLHQLMTTAGLTDIQRWHSDRQDCAALPVSLNLQGTKESPLVVSRVWPPLPKIAAVMSMPRLAFTDNLFCGIGIATQLGIPLDRVTGAFWGQCLERIMEQALDQADYLLTLDYDSVFTVNHVRVLAGIMQDNPHIDALCPLEVKREEEALLLGVLRDDGTPYPPGQPITLDLFQRQDLTRLSWGHFGLTLFRVSRLRDLPHPWFLSVPNAEGRWGEGRLDDDLYFWRQWRASGRTLYLANRVPIGHGQLMITWPGADGSPVHQYPTEFNHGKLPANLWL